MIVLSKPQLTTTQLVCKIAFSELMQGLFGFFLISSIASREILGIIFCVLPTAFWTYNLYTVLQEWKSTR